MMMVKMIGPNFLIVKNMNSCPVAEVIDSVTTWYSASGYVARNRKLSGNPPCCEHEI